MITPEHTKIENLGLATGPSPLRLSTVRGDGIGNFIPDRARVRYAVEFDTGRESQSTGVVLLHVKQPSSMTRCCRSQAGSRPCRRPRAEQTIS